MSLEHWRDIKKRQGKIGVDREVDRLLEKFGEAPLPGKEKIDIIVGFSRKQKEQLQEEGYEIYSLTGKSIQTLKDEGNSIYVHTIGNKDVSRKTEAVQVAVGGPLAEVVDRDAKLYDQNKAIKVFNEEISKRIPGVEVVIGNPNQYVELALMSVDRTSFRHRIFGPDDEFGYTVTKKDRVLVGGYQRKGLHCYYLGRPDNKIFYYPLIVPSK